MNAALRICPAFGFILLQTGETLNAVFIRRRKERRKVFFSEEKKQKTCANSDPRAPAWSATALVKVFWFFSSEKNTSFLTSHYT